MHYIPHILVATGVALGATGHVARATETTEPAPPSDSTASTPVIDPGDGGDYAPSIDPADFVDVVDNRYFPLAPGTCWVYGGEGAHAERIKVEVLTERRDIMGISAVVVRDTVSVDGETTEDTYDWFAQDRESNVWYLGEDTQEFDNGETSDAGSWEYGVDGALPGIVMPADPAVGDAYRQEYYAGEAEDMGEILEVGVTHSIGLGDYDDVVVTEDWTPLDPDVVENKYYAPGVGLIYETHVTDDTGAVELVEFTQGC